MPILLMLMGGAGLLAATAALWVQGTKRWRDQRFFAGLVATALTLSLFSLLASTATLIAGVLPLPLGLAAAIALALFLAVRVYRELRLPSSSEPS
jgi:hypothetical protein